MKAQELMLGSLVQLAYDYYDVPKGTMFKVVEIYADTIFAQDIEGAYEGMELPEYKLEPIPLTPEILEKNGIVEGRVEDIYSVFRHNDFTVTPDIDDDYQKCWMLYVGNRDHDANICIHYVHELQHALRLCGIEKEIVL